MSAARLHQPTGPVVIEQVAIPSPGPGEVLLRIEACGLCHSDLFIRSLDRLPRAPLTLGHEAIGVVEQAGSGVEQFGPGDRAGLTYLFSSCGQCEYCRSGRSQLCPEQLNTGYHVDGAFAEYAIGRADHLVKVPAELSAAQAAPLCCAGWTAYHAVGAAGLPPGSWLAIFGVGGLGHLAVQFARLAELRVAAVDVSAEKLSLAKQMGAEVVINAAQEDAARAFKKLGGAHGAITFVASATVVRQAFRCLRRAGVLVLVGLAAETFELPLVEIVLKAIHLRGSFLGRQEELQEIFELARRGDVRIETQSCSLETLPEAMDQMQAGKLPGRTVVTFP